MKVILIKKVPSLGKVGEVKEVSDGYARNFLIPQGFVRLANDSTIREMGNKESQKQKKQMKKTKHYKEMVKKLDNLKLIIKSKADDKKTLFAAIKPAQIIKELKERKFDIPVDFIKLDEPIKQLGYYDIKIQFSDELTAKVGLTIEREDS